MEDLSVKMFHKDDHKKVAYVTNQIQRDAFIKEGFEDAPESQQPEPKDGQPAVIPQDSHQAEEFTGAERSGVKDS